MSKLPIRLLLTAIEEGIPHLLPAELKIYHPFTEHLYTIDDVVVYKERIVIPPSLRKHCLEALH